MKRCILTITFLLTLFTVSFSQESYAIRQAMDFYRTNKLQTEDWKATLSENDIMGSPYLNDEFVNGMVFTTTKQKFVDIPLRYNIYNDQVEFKTPDNNIQALATPEIVEAIEFGAYKMVYVPYSDGKKIKHGFFIVEVEGNASLYSRSKVNYKKAEEPGAYKEAVPAKFVKKPDTFYIKIGTAQAKHANNKKELIAIFPDHQNEISSFIKKNKTKINKLEHLKELIGFYNTL